MPRDPGPAREKILEAADHLFGSTGFDETTTRQIAERSGVNKALIHYHFEGKDALFRAVLDRHYGRLAAVLAPALTHEGDVRARFEAVLDAYVDFLAANQGFSRMLQREISGGRHVDHIASHMAGPFRAAVAGISAAFPTGQAGELSAPHVLVSFFGMVVTWFSYAPIVAQLIGVDPLSPEGLEQRKRHVRRMLDLVLAALAPDPHGAHPHGADDARSPSSPPSPPGPQEASP